MPPENLRIPTSNKDFFINTNFNYVYGEWSYARECTCPQKPGVSDPEVEFQPNWDSLQEQYESLSSSKRASIATFQNQT